MWTGEQCYCCTEAIAPTLGAVQYCCCMWLLHHQLVVDKDVDALEHLCHRLELSNTAVAQQHLHHDLKLHLYSIWAGLSGLIS